MKETFASLDCETSGLNPEAHEILSLSVVILNESFEVEESIPPFDVRIKASKEVDVNATLINGLNPNEGISIDEVESSFIKWAALHGIEKIIPVGYNVSFDLSFVKQHLPKVAGKFSHHHRDVMQLVEIINDLHQLTRGEKMFQSCSLGNVLKTLGMSDEGSHNAYTDAVNASKVYSYLISML